MSAPRIAVLCSHRELDSGPHDGQQFVNQAYLAAVEAAGGTPFALPHLDADRVLDLLSLADGVLIPGGPDVDPRLYHQQPRPKLGEVCPRRDEIDRLVVEYVRERPELPVLGICRGAQSMNVFAGGTLTQDIGSEVEGALKHSQSAPRWYPTHDINVAEASRLREILGTDRLSVNSFHHQAVAQAAEGFRAVAHAEDGVIEAIEREDAPFCIGLQCHPELMAPRDERIARIFEAFVAACQG